MDEETEANLPLTSFYIMKKKIKRILQWPRITYLKKKKKYFNSIPITALSITSWAPFTDSHKLSKPHHHL